MVPSMVTEARPGVHPGRTFVPLASRRRGVRVCSRNLTAYFASTPRCGAAASKERIMGTGTAAESLLPHSPRHRTPGMRLTQRLRRSWHSLDPLARLAAALFIVLYTLPLSVMFATT